jgi:hypothetical protein
MLNRYFRSLLMVGSLAPLSLAAQTASTSASFALNQDGGGSGGGRISNAGATIVADTSTGGSFGGGVSNVTTSGFQMKPNYTGQLSDVENVTVAASPATVDEGGTRQFEAVATMDDGTTLTNPLSTIWEFVGQAIVSLDAPTRTATAGIVFEDTPATVEATILGTTGDLEVTILNINADNFAEYAGDGLDDGWQVNFFGTPPNTDAGPGENPDGDPFNNADEFLTGFSPVDGGDFLKLSLQSVSAGTATLVINKVIPGPIYTIWAGTDLSGSFPEVVTGSAYTYLAEETDTLVIDTSAGSGRKFYILEVTEVP